MPSVDKALRSLLYLAEVGGRGASLAQIAGALGLNKTSLHLTLAALRFRDFVSQDAETGNYRLGGRVQALSRSFLDGLSMPAGLQMAIRRLADDINEVIHVAILDGTSVLFIDKAVSRKPIQAATGPGMRFPAVTTATGRAILSQQFSDFDAFRLRYPEVPEPRTRRSPVSLEQAWMRVADARRLGYGVDLEENFEGLTALAIAVLDGDEPIGAVSVVALASETKGDAPLTHLHALRECVTSVLTPPQRVQEPIP